MLEFLSCMSFETLLTVLSELYTDLTAVEAVSDYNQAAAIEIGEMIAMIETVMGGKQ